MPACTPLWATRPASVLCQPAVAATSPAVVSYWPGVVDTSPIASRPSYLTSPTADASAAQLLPVLPAWVGTEDNGRRRPGYSSRPGHIRRASRSSLSTE